MGQHPLSYQNSEFQNQAVLNAPGTSLWPVSVSLAETTEPMNVSYKLVVERLRFLFVLTGVLGVQIHILQDPESFQPHQTGTFHKSGHHLCDEGLL